MKLVFPDDPGGKPPTLGILLLVLLIVEGFIAVAIITGKVSPRTVTGLLVAGFLVALMVLFAGTLVIWNRPSRSDLRSEVIIDIPPASLEQIRQDFVSEGARVIARQQADGLYRVEAFFLNDARGSCLRSEVIVDIPPTSLEQIREDFVSEGARVVAEQQADGRYRIEAFFVSDARGF